MPKNYQCNNHNHSESGIVNMILTDKFCHSSGRQNQRPIVPDEWHNPTGRVAVTVDMSDGRVAIIEQNTKKNLTF